MTALGTLLGFAFLDDLTADQQNSLGNFLMLIAQVLETNASQKQLLEDLAQTNQISQMQQELAALRQEMESLRNSLH